MTYTEFLQLFPNPRKTSKGHLVSCPGPNHQHGDRKPSLSIGEGDNGGILLHCFGGCTPAEILGAIGLELSDLFPERESTSNARQRPFSAHDALIALEFEATIVQIAASDLAAGKAITEADRLRLNTAADRIRTTLEVLRG